MSATSNSNWWEFSIDPETRGTEIATSDTGLKQVNPKVADGRHLLDYHTYLGLGKLLDCQVPGSMVPDERCFIITHQLFELTFKQMIFDLSVISETLKQLLQVPDEEFHTRCTTSSTTSVEAFWQPALTAAGRFKYSSKVLLPAFIGFLANTEGKDETFASVEFQRFRSYVPPASGFQSAQYRLIQRALGKANLLSVRLFPAAEYWKNYEGKDEDAPASVVDSVILRKDAEVASPSEDSPLQRTALLDQHVHRVLERLDQVSNYSETGSHVSGIRYIFQNDVERAVENFRHVLSGHRSQQERAGKKPAEADEKDRGAEAIFRRDLEVAVKAENERRTSLKAARRGAFYLHYMSPSGSLALVLNRLVSADSALHGKHEESFISLHFRLAADRIRDLYLRAKQVGEVEPPSGTGGGGVPYLGHMRKNLIPLFPALVAYLGLEDTSTFSWVE
jgi:tryptophan 2,3-dioxygenase